MLLAVVQVPTAGRHVEVHRDSLHRVPHAVHDLDHQGIRQLRRHGPALEVAADLGDLARNASRSRGREGDGSVDALSRGLNRLGLGIVAQGVRHRSETQAVRFHRLRGRVQRTSSRQHLEGDVDVRHTVAVLVLHLDHERVGKRVAGSAGLVVTRVLFDRHGSIRLRVLVEVDAGLHAGRFGVHRHPAGFCGEAQAGPGVAVVVGHVVHDQRLATGAARRVAGDVGEQDLVQTRVRLTAVEVELVVAFGQVVEHQDVVRVPLVGRRHVEPPLVPVGLQRVSLVHLHTEERVRGARRRKHASPQLVRARFGDVQAELDATLAVLSGGHSLAARSVRSVQNGDRRNQVRILGFEPDVAVEVQAVGAQVTRPLRDAEVHVDAGTRVAVLVLHLNHQRLRQSLVHTGGLVVAGNDVDFGGITALHRDGEVVDPHVSVAVDHHAGVVVLRLLRRVRVVELSVQHTVQENLEVVAGFIGDDLHVDHVADVRVRGNVRRRLVDGGFTLGHAVHNRVQRQVVVATQDQVAVRRGARLVEHHGHTAGVHAFLIARCPLEGHFHRVPVGAECGQVVPAGGRGRVHKFVVLNLVGRVGGPVGPKFVAIEIVHVGELGRLGLRGALHHIRNARRIVGVVVGTKSKVVRRSRRQAVDDGALEGSGVSRCRRIRHLGRLVEIFLRDLRGAVTNLVTRGNALVAVVAGCGPLQRHGTLANQRGCQIGYVVGELQVRNHPEIEIVDVVVVVAFEHHAAVVVRRVALFLVGIVQRGVQLPVDVAFEVVTVRVRVDDHLHLVARLRVGQRRVANRHAVPRLTVLDRVQFPPLRRGTTPEQVAVSRGVRSVQHQRKTARVDAGFVCALCPVKLHLAGVAHVLVHSQVVPGINGRGVGQFAVLDLIFGRGRPGGSEVRAVESVGAFLLVQVIHRVVEVDVGHLLVAGIVRVDPVTQHHCGGVDGRELVHDGQRARWDVRDVSRFGVVVDLDQLPVEQVGPIHVVFTGDDLADQDLLQAGPVLTRFPLGQVSQQVGQMACDGVGEILSVVVRVGDDRVVGDVVRSQVHQHQIRLVRVHLVRDVVLAGRVKVGDLGAAVEPALVRAVARVADEVEIDLGVGQLLVQGPPEPEAVG